MIRPPSRTFRSHLSDAAFHARLMHRSLSQAADLAQTNRGSRRLQGLAENALHWARELDPETHRRRERDGVRT
jgi:hypothetical protein